MARTISLSLGLDFTEMTVVQPRLDDLPARYSCV